MVTVVSPRRVAACPSPKKRKDGTGKLSLPEYVMSLIVMFGGYMICLFGVSGHVRPAGLTAFAVMSIAGIGYVMSAWFIYGSNIQVLMWVADLMEDRVLRTRENWKNETLRSMVEVGSWLHITFRIYACFESALVAAICGAVVGAFCVVLGDYFTDFTRRAEQRLLDQVALTSYEMRRRLSDASDDARSTSDEYGEREDEEEEQEEQTDQPAESPNHGIAAASRRGRCENSAKELASVVVTPQFFSLLVAFAFALALYYVQDSQDMGLAVLLTTMTNVAFITSEQVLMLWRPTRWAAVILHDRVVNVVYNWQHETIRSGFETCFYLSSIFSCYLATESPLISVAVGTLAGIVIILLSSWVRIGRQSSSAGRNACEGKADGQETFHQGVFMLAIFGWAVASLLYTIYVHSDDSVLAFIIVIPTTIAIVCVSEMAVISTMNRLISNGNTKLKSKWSVFQFTVGTLLFSQQDQQELPAVRFADVLCENPQRTESRKKLVRQLCFNKTTRTVSAADLGRDFRGRKVVVVEDYIFDVEDFCAKHPGGEELLRDYGTRHADVSDQFAAFHHPDTYKYLVPLLLGKLESQGSCEQASEQKEGELKEREAINSDYRALRDFLWNRGYFSGAENDFLSARACAYQHLVVLSLAVLVMCQVALLGRSDDANSSFSFLQRVMQCTLAGVTTGFFWQQVAFIAHDALHNGVVNRTKQTQPSSMRSKLIPNNMLGWFHGSICFGISSAMWLEEHSVHHAITMRPCQDAQFNYLPLWCVSLKEFATRSWLDRKGTSPVLSRIISGVTSCLVAVQHWTLLPLAVLIGRFNFYLVNLAYAAKNAIYYDLIGMMIYWVVYLGMVFYIGDFTLQLCFVLVSHWTCGILHVQLLINHLATDAFTPAEEESLGFFLHQLMTTRDISCSDSMEWFHGGLHLQVCHHLMPQLPRHRLKLVTPAIKDICARHGVRYETVDFFQAVRLTLSNFREIATDVWTGNLAA